jgi:signal transduction histidine kinase
MIPMTISRPEALFEQSSEALCVVTLDGHIRDANRHACEVLSSTPEKLAGHTLLDLPTAKGLHGEPAVETASGILAGMRHDLCTPLNGIIGFSDLLERRHFGPLTDRQQMYVQCIRACGHELLKLVNEIVDLSKIEADLLSLTRELTSVEPLAEAAQCTVQPLAASKGITVKVSLRPDLPKVLIDPVRIEQVLCILLSDAVKFTPAGGSVWLTAEAGQSSIQLGVAGTGMGVGAEDLSRVSGEFDRVQASLESEPGGLGLALAKRLVRMHGGDLDVRTEPRTGYTFRITLPLRQRLPVSPGAGHNRAELAKGCTADGA